MIKGFLLLTPFVWMVIYCALFKCVDKENPPVGALIMISTILVTAIWGLYFIVRSFL